MYLGREITESSLNSIALEFGVKDHTTVLHAYKKIKGLLEKDKNLKDVVENLKEKINE